MAINQTVMTGNLVRDSEFRTTTAGTGVLSFSVAVEEYRKDAENYVSFFDFVMFGNRAEKLKDILVKGVKVTVDAHARQNRWEQDGQNRQKVEFIVRDIEIMSKERVEVYDEDVPF